MLLAQAEGHIDDLRLKAQQSIDADPFAALNAAMGTVSTNAATAQVELIATGAAVQIAQALASGSGEMFDPAGNSHPARSVKCRPCDLRQAQQFSRLFSTS